MLLFRPFYRFSKGFLATCSSLVICAGMLTTLSAGDSGSLNLTLRVGDIDAVLADSLLDRDQLSLSVVSDLDLSETVTAALQSAAEQAVKDDSVLDGDGNVVFSIETSPVLSIVIPPGTFAQLDVNVVDPNNFLAGIGMLDKRGELPDGARYNTVKPGGSSAALISQAGGSAFITSLKLDFKIPVTAAGQDNDIEITYSIKNVI